MTDSAASTPLHWLQGIASELEGLRTVAVQNLSRRVGVPTRDEFEVQRGLLEDARGRLARIEAQLDALARQVGGVAP
jgi:BMFP domain-containing protein YqiC